MRCLSVLMIVVFLGLSINSVHSNADGVLPEKDEGNIGEIRYSILDQASFQKLYGTEWVLMDGRVLPADSDLRKEFNMNNVPDARGLFLRVKDYGRNAADGKGNVNGDLPIGTFQDDMFQGHGHKVTSSKGILAIGSNESK